MTRNTKLKLAIAAVIAPLGIAVAASTSSNAPTLTGESYSVYAQTSSEFVPRTGHAILPDGGGMGSGEGADVNVAGVIAAEALDASVTGVGDLEDASVQGFSTVASANVLGGLVNADGIVAMTASALDGGVAASNSEGSMFTRIEVAGVVLNTDVEPNTTLPLPGVGSVTLREEVRAGDGVNSSSITVNMIHVRLTNPLTGEQTGEIIVGSARSSVAR